MRYEIHDTSGKTREVIINREVGEVRALLGEFKTHCVIAGSQYEFNHFVNWLRKNYQIEVEQFSNDRPARVDM